MFVLKITNYSDGLEFGIQIRQLADGGHSIGYTSDIDQRLLSHNQLATKGFTVKYRPWELFYSETFDAKSEAMKREKELKSFIGREFLRSQLKLS